MAQIASGASADLLTVDPTSKAARATLYAPDGTAMAFAEGAAYADSHRGMPVAGANDGNWRIIRVDRLGNVGSALFTPMLWEAFEGTVLASNRWVSAATTMTAAQTAATGLQFNSSNITTVNTGYLFYSLKQFVKIPKVPMLCRSRLRLNAVANSWAQWGFGNATVATTDHTIGAYWELTQGGVIQPVLMFNGGAVTGSNVAGSINAANYYTWDVIWDDDHVHFLVQDATTGIIINEQKIYLAATGPKMFNATHLPASFRLANGAVAPGTAPQMFLAEISVGAYDAVYGKSVEDVMASAGQSALYSPTAFTQAANFANSAAPASATLSNTAAGYTTLGGLFQFAAVAGAVTDYNLFNFTVPSPYQLKITDIEIDAWNTGAAVATTPTLLVWGIGVNATTANLSTGGYIRTMLGGQSFPVGAAVGARADGRISRTFKTPIVCEAGRLLSLILRMPVGTATASQVIQGSALIHGYFE